MRSSTGGGMTTTGDDDMASTQLAPAIEAYNKRCAQDPYHQLIAAKFNRSNASYPRLHKKIYLGIGPMRSG